ncbi:MAG: hypothetical protein AB8H47_08120 [Bacteroidia bacterium]
MKENLSFYESEVKSILGLPPSWLLRSGSYLIVGVLILFISLGLFWRYPDTYTISVQTFEPGELIPLALPLGAELDTILVTDRQQVEADEMLLLYRNGAFREALSSPHAGQIFWLGDDQKGTPLALLADTDPYGVTVRVDKQYLSMLQVGERVSLRGAESPVSFGYIEHFRPEGAAFVVQIKTEKLSTLDAFADELQLSFITNEKPIFAKLLNN